MTSASEALERLRQGNERFVTGRGTLQRDSERRRAELLQGQKPVAAILGCSDSRVPTELIFDQGFGDLFVIRVAGNVVASSQIGSIEFAVERFGIQLVVVLGHTQCGAVQATLEELARPGGSQSKNLKAIVDRIRPAIADWLPDSSNQDPGTLSEKAIRSNVLHSAEQLRHGSEILEQLLAKNELQVVGAEYSLETGAVEFFHGL